MIRAESSFRRDTASPRQEKKATNLRAPQSTELDLAKRLFYGDDVTRAIRREQSIASDGYVDYRCPEHFAAVSPTDRLCWQKIGCEAAVATGSRNL